MLIWQGFLITLVVRMAMVERVNTCGALRPSYVLLAISEFLLSYFYAPACVQTPDKKTTMLINRMSPPCGRK